METKEGEIFEYNGEWYQCVESKQDTCTDCAFNPINNIRYNCSGSCAYKKVIFKKLEKVGEPYTHYCPSGRIIYFQRYKIFNKLYYHNTEYIMCDFNEDGIVSIEIKQNKEDMEENKLNLKPFDIQKAREGKPVCTRDGRKARIICFDFRDADEICCIIAAVDYGEAEKIHYYDLYGKYRGGDSSEHDLMMLPEKKEGWVNVYYDNEASSHRGCRYIYDTKEQAIKEAGSNYIATIKIEWEE